MRSNSKLLTFLLILLFFSVLYPLKATIAAPRTNQGLVPFIGMEVDYNLVIIIDRNILTCPEDDIKDTKVLTTYLGGETIFES